MISVEIRNFQSLEDVSLEIDGFTALVGKSNIGKSALVRAIKSALTNAPLGTSLRHTPNCPRLKKGAKSCKCFVSVKIQAPDWNLLWEKGDSVNRYTFNGAVYDRPGTGTPEFLANVGFAPLKIGDSYKSLQVADQFFPLFLLDASESAVADTIADVSRLDKINVAIKAAHKDLREASSLRKVREQDLSKVRTRLGAFVGLDPALDKVRRVVELQDRISVARNTVVQLSTFHERARGIAFRLSDLQPILSMELPDPNGYREAKVELETLSGFITRAEQLRQAAQKASGALQVLAGFPTEAPEFEAHLGKVRQLDRWVQTHPALEAAVARLGRIDQVSTVRAPDLQSAQVKVQTLDRYLTRLGQLERPLTRLSKVEGCMVPDKPDFSQMVAKVSAMARYIAQIETIQGRMRVLEDAAVKAEAEEAEVKREIETLGVCPTCERPYQVGHEHA